MTFPLVVPALLNRINASPAELVWIVAQLLFAPAS